MQEGINIRWDEGAREYVLTFEYPKLGRTFEASNGLLSLAVLQLSEEMENEGI